MRRIKGENRDWGGKLRGRNTSTGTHGKGGKLEKPINRLRYPRKRKGRPYRQWREAWGRKGEPWTTHLEEGARRWGVAPQRLDQEGWSQWSPSLADCSRFAKEIRSRCGHLVAEKTEMDGGVRLRTRGLKNSMARPAVRPKSRRWRVCGMQASKNDV